MLTISLSTLSEEHLIVRPLIHPSHLQNFFMSQPGQTELWLGSCVLSHKDLALCAAICVSCCAFSDSIISTKLRISTGYECGSLNTSQHWGLALPYGGPKGGLQRRRMWSKFDFASVQSQFVFQPVCLMLVKNFHLWLLLWSDLSHCFSIN